MWLKVACIIIIQFNDVVLVTKIERGVWRRECVSSTELVVLAVLLNKCCISLCIFTSCHLLSYLFPYLSNLCLWPSCFYVWYDISSITRSQFSHPMTYHFPLLYRIFCSVHCNLDVFSDDLQEYFLWSVFVTGFLSVISSWKRNFFVEFFQI